MVSHTTTLLRQRQQQALPIGTMEADIARMVVDLGVATRDIVSAPEERGGGRRGGGGDWRAEERAMKAAQAHREQARSGPEDNARAQMLKKWNTEETFGSDAVCCCALHMFSTHTNPLMDC